MITIKNPVRLAAIVIGTTAFFIFGQTLEAGWAFLIGALVGSISFGSKSE
jgi:hypothetical protein